MASANPVANGSHIHLRVQPSAGQIQQFTGLLVTAGLGGVVTRCMFTKDSFNGLPQQPQVNSVTNQNVWTFAGHDGCYWAPGVVSNVLDDAKTSNVIFYLRRDAFVNFFQQLHGISNQKAALPMPNTTRLSPYLSETSRRPILSFLEI